MWRNPKYESQIQPEPEPPVEQGRTLCTFERNRGSERTRVSLETFNNSPPFVRIQGWVANPAGEWWPARGKCVTVPMRLVDQLIAGLRQAEDLAGEIEQERLESPRPATPRQTHQEPSQRSDGPATAPWQDEGGEPVYRERKRRPDGRTMTDRERGILAARSDEGDFDEFGGARP